MKLPVILYLIMAVTLQAFAQRNLTVDAKNSIAEVPATMWGVFFEDINFSADGGLYAELVKNRSFEFRNPLQGWGTLHLSTDKGELVVINEQKRPTANKHFARISKAKADTLYGIVNEGFRGIGIKKGEQYNCYIRVKKHTNDFKIKMELANAKGTPIGSASLSGFGADWKEYQVAVVAQETCAKASLRILFEGEGIVDVDMISMFPENTWKKRPKGLRADLVQLLADLEPGFVRFPGGCIVEGYDLATRYQWKNTVGPIEDRVLIKSRWMDEFMHRLAPDYYQSYGIGFYEYFILSEDLGAQPLPILNCGMACQFNSKEVVAMEELQPYIQDALDLIEFANGATTTKWGKLREQMGHPEPFKLKYLGIGNEQWGPQYIERYAEFQKVLKEKHPEIVLISAAGPFPGELNDFLWDELKKLNADIVDEHYYRSPDWFFENANRYDSFDRKGPKVFAGEYASHTGPHDAPEGRNNWHAALSEAAFMTGLERNADIVCMTAYAPLLAHKEAWQWNPDMIWFDNLTATPTPNYFVQQLFSLNKGTRVLPITEGDKALTGQEKLYASCTIDDKAKMMLVKLVNTSDKAQSVKLKMKGVSLNGTTAVMETLTGELATYNEVGGTNNFVKTQTELKNKATIELAPHSVNVVKMPLK